MAKLDALKYAQQLSKGLNALGIGDSAPVRAAKQLARRVVEKWFSENGELIVPVHGLRLSVPEARYLYLYRSYEPYTSELFVRAARTNAAVLDIGACFGYYSLLAAQVLEPGGVVYAFEPAPENFAVLVRNIELNGFTGTIFPERKAVGDHTSRQSLHLSQFAENNSLAAEPLFPTIKEVVVDETTIDASVGDRRVALIKMDIEGFEPYALAGMRHTLERNRDVTLLTELNVDGLRGAGARAEQFLDQLRELGFQVQLIDEAERRLLPVTREAIALAEAEPARYSNLLCRRSD